MVSILHGHLLAENKQATMDLAPFYPPCLLFIHFYPLNMTLYSLQETRQYLVWDKEGEEDTVDETATTLFEAAENPDRYGDTTRQGRKRSRSKSKSKVRKGSKTKNKKSSKVKGKGRKSSSSSTGRSSSPSSESSSKSEEESSRSETPEAGLLVILCNLCGPGRLQTS